jgi:hypothetical protein
MTPTQTPAQKAVPAFIRESRYTARDGRPVKILSFDGADSDRPIIGQYMDRTSGTWYCQTWRLDGHWKSDGEDYGLDLIEIPAPQSGDAISILEKWHNWIATGQLAFTDEHLAESKEVLEAAGRIALDRVAPEPRFPWKGKTPEEQAALDDFNGMSDEEFFGLDASVGAGDGPTKAKCPPCINSGACQAANHCIVDHRAEAPEPASVATPLPEGVPALDGEFADFEYSGTKRLVGVPSCGSPDIILFDDIEGWMKNYCGEWWDGSDDISHKAIRRGTELHRLNFTPASDLQHALQGGLEADGNAASEGAGAFRDRHFARKDGFRWTVKSRGITWHWGGQSGICAFGIEELIGDPGVYETTADGTPLEGGEG